MLLFNIFIFFVSCLTLGFAGVLIVKALTRICKFLGWREFVVAFFIMAFVSSLPNLFVGISSAIKGVPELSFGDVVGGNVVDLTLVIALAALLNKGIPAESRMVQTSSIFTIIIAVLPLLLVADGKLHRTDGIILILSFIFYTLWLFSKEERFTKVYDGIQEEDPVKKLKNFLKDLMVVVPGIILLLLAAQGIVGSASYFAKTFNCPLVLVGVLIVGLGNCLPEIYFSIISARKGESWLILGNLMGSVAVTATLVLGIVALISPIKITDFSVLALARVFLIISAVFFLFFLRTDKEITKKEALFLLGLYILFVSAEILTK